MLRIVLSAMIGCGALAAGVRPAAAQGQTSAAAAMAAERQMVAMEALRAYEVDLGGEAFQLMAADLALDAKRQQAIDRLEDLSSEEAATSQPAELRRLAERLNRIQQADLALETARVELTQREDVVDRLARTVDRAQTALGLSEAEWAELAADLEEAQFLAALALDDRVEVEVISLPRDSATVFYQTKRARERGDAPETLPAPTNRKQPLIRGCYYIWARWSDGTTTDPNRSQCFDRENIELTLR